MQLWGGEDSAVTDDLLTAYRREAVEDARTITALRAERKRARLALIELQSLAAREYDHARARAFFAPLGDYGALTERVHAATVERDQRLAAALSRLVRVGLGIEEP